MVGPGAAWDRKSSNYTVEKGNVRHSPKNTIKEIKKSVGILLLAKTADDEAINVSSHRLTSKFVDCARVGDDEDDQGDDEHEEQAEY